ncbi:MAG: D-alanyl-D-alanine dipeptidase, partial [Verrucomicrobia bacterium]|nr:D-alanyl-D-alanine dipeptidase [Verrucomicrobiota bacterium]
MKASQQLIVVVNQSWPAASAVIHLYERGKGGRWTQVGQVFPAVLGARGLRWGVGLHGRGGTHGEPIKREGDYSSPAGVFRLFAAFGAADPTRLKFLRFPYQQVGLSTEAIDDPHSKYYNRIVDRREISRPDWTHSEAMGRVGGRYRLGIMVEHNWKQISGAGSCVF